MTAPGLTAAERAIVRVVAVAQFVNVLEFIVVMPLGPDYAKALAVPPDQLPLVASSYTAAAAIAGLIGALFLDRFDRRKALLFSLCGLVVSTTSAGFVHDFHSLIAARALAGFFGGPATSISLSIVADAVPAERRGTAMSRVLIANAIASTLGVPVALKLAEWAGWRTPFFAIAGLGALGLLLASTLPPLTAHLGRTNALSPTGLVYDVVRRPLVQLSFLMTVVVQLSGFLVIPMLSPYVQYNVGFPRKWLGMLYLAGGATGLVSTRTVGSSVDRFGSLRVGAVSLVMLSLVTFFGLVYTPPISAMAPMFIGFFVALGMRNVAYNTLASKVPASSQRACFQSLQSAVGHISIACGSALAAHVLSAAPSGALIGMPRLALLSIGVSALLPILMWQVERRVNAGLSA